MSPYQPIDVPFEMRFSCWFCGEPSKSQLQFPRYRDEFLTCEHQPLSLPCCGECLVFGRELDDNSIFAARLNMKQKLMRKYHKHLAIGINWTEQELAESDMEGKAFEGFKRIAWSMYLISRDRINFPGWSVSVDGLLIEDTSEALFSFDGVTYASLALAIEHYARVFDINSEFLGQVVQLVGPQRFAYGVKFARQTVGFDQSQRITAMAQLRAMNSVSG